MPTTQSCPAAFSRYSHGHHRDLPSFPTRRSSDLAPPRAEHVAGEAFGVHPHQDVLAVLHVPVDQRHVQDRKNVLVRMQDRKSTRLNSSHVAISYAVFCLKKKKQNK